MARAPKRERGPVRRLLRGAVALGGGAIDCLLHPGTFLRSKNARRASAAAAMARKNWRADAHPAGEPLLRRAAARARGAVDAVLHPGRRAAARARGAVDAVLHPGWRALAVIRNLLQRVRAVGRDFLQRVLRLVPEFLRRLLRRRQPFLPQGEDTPPPSPTSPPPRQQSRPKRCAWYYPRPARRSISPPPPTPPTPPTPVYVGGEQVPEKMIRLYVEYCTRPCPPKSTVCHFCTFEEQKARKCTVSTDRIIVDCDNFHLRNGRHVRCDEPGCSVRVRPGLDQERHVHFCHRSPADWWKKYVRQPQPCDQ